MRLASQKECTGCMGCINSCHRNVLDYRFDKNGYFRVFIKNSQNCTNCNYCSQTCPVVSPVKNKNTTVLGFASWNLNNKQRKLSASGGVFAAIATTILNNGGVVYGAAIDGFEVKHIRIDKLEDLYKLQGSKYQLSIINIFQQVRNDLSKKKTVLFSGMSCQVAALYNFLRHSNYEQLITVDTICGGYASLLPMKSLKNSMRYSAIVSWRDKYTGWKSKGFAYDLKMKKVNGEIESLGSDNIVIRIFSTHLLKQSSCLACKFNGTNRVSDLTIGDFWGDTQFPMEHEHGLSCVVVHNDKALQLFKASDLGFVPVGIDAIALGNANLYWSKYRYLRHSLSRKLALFFLRHEMYDITLKLCSYNGIFSLGWRVYMRFNERKKKQYFNNHIK